MGAKGDEGVVAAPRQAHDVLDGEVMTLKGDAAGIEGAEIPDEYGVVFLEAGGELAIEGPGVEVGLAVVGGEGVGIQAVTKNAVTVEVDACFGIKVIFATNNGCQ